MKLLFLLSAVLIQVTVSQLTCCDYTGARCVNPSGEWIQGTCTKYYALCTDRHIQTAPIEVDDPIATSCRDGVIISADSCIPPNENCIGSEITCTDANGIEISDSCTSYYRECDAAHYGFVMPVAGGSKCLNGKFVLNSVCTSAECKFKGIQCTNGVGDFVNTYCTGFFVECNDGSISDPMAVPPGTQCYQNTLVIEGTCPAPVCSFTGFKCSDASGTLVSNTCTSYYVECDNGSYTTARPVAEGTQCYNDELIPAENCAGTECTGEGIVCSDSHGTLLTDTCTGYFRQCTEGTYDQPEIVPAGTRCKNGELVLTDTCNDVCTSGTRRCTDNTGSPLTNTCTLYYQTCNKGTFDSKLEHVDPGMSCYNGDLIPHSQCTSSNYECDFNGIRCSTAEGIITTDHCTDYYLQCEYGMYTEPRKTAEGTKCYNNEQVLSSSCAATCDFTGIQCSDHSGNIIQDRCTSYYVECADGFYSSPLPVADGMKCLNGKQVSSDCCFSPICNDDDIVCTNEQGIVEQTECTDYFMRCAGGIYITPEAVALGTKCRQGHIVLASNCTGTQCSFDGIKCSDAEGTIYENQCKSYFVQCNDGQLTAPLPVANNTRCYNGNLVNTDSCDYEQCDFTGIKCSDANGVVYYNHCTSYFLECTENGLSRPMPVAEGTQCYANKIVPSTTCDSSHCCYEGIQCSDANGNVYHDTCTNYYVECDNGIVTNPQPVAEGTKCYNGKQILSSLCTGAECTFEGIQCTDANGNHYEDTCTSYYVECDNGSYSAPMPVAEGTRCFKNTLIMASECSGTHCCFDGIQCSDAYGSVVTDVCTNYYIECNEGIITAPRPVAKGTKCLNGKQVLAETCEASQCHYKGIQCTNAQGARDMTSCTSYYVECDHGMETSPMPVAEGTRCLKNKIVSASKCSDTQCIDDTIQCTDANGNHYEDTCTSYYVECDNGHYSAPRPVADGTRCYNGKQITASECSGIQCTTDAIHCSDANGVITNTECTSYYVECDNGQYSSPMPVAEGTQCLKGELVLPFNCTSNQCDFSGIKCTDKNGIIYDSTCTDHFIECANGYFTNPMIVPNGAKCLAGELVLDSVCPGADCCYKGFKCTDSAGTFISNACTSYYVECENGKQTKPLPVAFGSRCLNNEFVPVATCTSPECTFEGIQCVSEDNTIQENTCTSYYRKCTNGVLEGPIAVCEGEQCYNNQLISSSDCPNVECDFTGFICSDAEGTFFTDSCRDYYVRCVNHKFSSPIHVAEGTKCYNQKIIDAAATVCDNSKDCIFEGIKCANSKGTIIDDHCTNYYVMCEDGVVTKPRLTAPGTKCYNDEQVISATCDAISCSFAGTICVNTCGDFVTNQCTTQYAECIDGQQVIKVVPSGKACYNSQLVTDTDSVCTMTVEVSESKMKGIRGHK